MQLFHLGNSAKWHAISVEIKATDTQLCIAWHIRQCEVKIKVLFVGSPPKPSTWHGRRRLFLLQSMAGGVTRQYSVYTDTAAYHIQSSLAAQLWNTSWEFRHSREPNPDCLCRVEPANQTTPQSLHRELKRDCLCRVEPANHTTPQSLHTLSQAQHLSPNEKFMLVGRFCPCKANM